MRGALPRLSRGRRSRRATRSLVGLPLRQELARGWPLDPCRPPTAVSESPHSRMRRLWVDQGDPHPNHSPRCRQVATRRRSPTALPDIERPHPRRPSRTRVRPAARISPSRATATRDASRLAARLTAASIWPLITSTSMPSCPCNDARMRQRRPSFPSGLTSSARRTLTLGTCGPKRHRASSTRRSTLAFWDSERARRVPVTSILNGSAAVSPSSCAALLGGPRPL